MAAVLKKICNNSIVSPKCVPTTHTHNLTGKRIEPSTEACMLKENPTPVWTTAESSALTKTSSFAPSNLNLEAITQIIPAGSTSNAYQYKNIGECACV